MQQGPVRIWKNPHRSLSAFCWGERESENRRAEQKWRNGGAERGRGSEKRSGSRESEERIRGAEQRIGAGAGNGAAEREWGLEERSAGAEQRSGAVWGSEDIGQTTIRRNQIHQDQFRQTGGFAPVY